VGHGRGVGGGVRAARAQCLSPAIQRSPRRIRHLRRPLCRRGPRAPWPSFRSSFVQPSELALETPYLKHYIDFTRKAYQLDKIQETSYPALADLTPAVLARNEDTIQNIRLWDSRPLLQTYQQTQAIRLYYQFYDVAVDRYHLADGYHQVMLSTRELAQELPAKAQTWVNQRLQFTHGYGLVMSFVSKTVGGGFPQYLLRTSLPNPRMA
jgi:uncharacterized membrane protein (UPF0182 family)